mgnify:CR=1 FL=1
MKKFTNTFSKKGQAGTDSALIQLFYIILGVFVLLTFVKIIFSFLDLNERSNNDIVTKNANSIAEFKKYSDKYESLAPCYTMLKIGQLENYQNVEDENTKDKSYALIISETGVYKHDLLTMDKFYKNPDSQLTKPVIKFEDKVVLVTDNTYQGDVFDDIFLISSDEFLNFDKNVKYIILIPEFDNANTYTTSEIREDNSKSWYEFGDNEYQIDGSNYLVYSPQSKFFFISASSLSDSFIFPELCSYKTLQNKIKTDKYEEMNGRSIPYSLYDIYFSIFKDGKDTGYKFTWSDEIICEKNNTKLNCNTELGILDAYNLEYEDFIIEIETYMVEKLKLSNSEFDLNLKVTYKELTPQQAKIRKESNSKFEYLNYMYVFSSSRKHPNLEFYTSDELENNNIYDLSLFNNDKINHCETNECNYLYFYNQKIYFYLHSDLGKNIYAAINEDYFQKKVNPNNKYGYDLYFNGELIDEKNIDIDKTHSFGSGDSKDIYEIDGIEVTKGNRLEIYKVLMSKEQFNSISEYK